LPQDMVKEHPDGVFHASSTQGGWCTCGCGNFKVSLLDDCGLSHASFGFSRDDWLRWLEEAKAVIEAGQPPEFLS
jgi:hypothetical protein